jgi:hypothetical protein
LSGENLAAGVRLYSGSSFLRIVFNGSGMDMGWKRVVISLVASVLMVGCSSRSNNEMRAIDTQLDAKGSTGTHVVGVDRNGDATLQEERQLSSEIRTMQHVNENLRLDLRSEFFNLKDCLKRRAKAGDGKMPEISDFDDIETATNFKEEVGIVDGQLKVVRKEGAVDRLKAERTQNDELRALLKSVKKHLERCEFETAEEGRFEGDSEAVEKRAVGALRVGMAGGDVTESTVLQPNASVPSRVGSRPKNLCVKGKAARKGTCSRIAPYSAVSE